MASLRQEDLLRLLRTINNIDPDNFPMFFEPREWNHKWWGWCKVCGCWTDTAHQVGAAHRDQCCSVVEKTNIVQLINEGHLKGPSMEVLSTLQRDVGASPAASTTALVPYVAAADQRVVVAAPCHAAAATAQQPQSPPVEASPAIEQQLQLPPVEAPVPSGIVADVPPQLPTNAANTCSRLTHRKAPPALPTIHEVTEVPPVKVKAPPPRRPETGGEPSPVSALPPQPTNAGNCPKVDFKDLRQRIRDLECKFTFIKDVLEATVAELARVRADLPEDSA